MFVAFAAAISNLRATDRWRADLAAARALNKLIAAAAKSRSGRPDHTIEKLMGPTRRRTRRPAAARAP